VLGPGGEPQFADLEVLEHRTRAADVVRVAMGDREHRDAAPTACEDRRNDDPVAGVEAPCLPGSRIHEHEVVPAV
jgi:hypothetical protein